MDAVKTVNSSVNDVRLAFNSATVFPAILNLNANLSTQSVAQAIFALKPESASPRKRRFQWRWSRLFDV